MDKTQQAYDLGKPFWMMARDVAPQREKAVEERIKELLEQRDLIDIELEVLRYSPQPAQCAKTGPNWESSISGFHSPQKHAGLTPAAFLDLYKQRLEKRGTPYHRQILTWVSSHEPEVITFIRQRFARTVMG